MAAQRINPIDTSEKLRETYLRYLTTIFGLKNPELARQFHDLAKKSEGLFKGPILEATPKYRKDKSLLEMLTVEHSVLSDQFLDYAPDLPENIVDKALDLERKLYTHQGRAIRKVVGQNRNIVVATGTGSGKTECFLLPIIDHLLKERAAKRLGPGVRALLVYPMNALANDQVDRLRRLLPPETGLTFGRYTGQTMQTYGQGLSAYQQEYGHSPQANELFCRDQILGREPQDQRYWPHPDHPIKVGPPHILLTNFAMLEYLLMRPDDSALFDGGNGETWRFLVLDEAHVYTGAQGTEIAYLMRRLKDRVCRSKPGKLLCIATSATVGASDESNKEKVAASFGNLFGENFEPKDVITSDVVPLQDFVAGHEIWGIGKAEFYRSLLRVVDADYATQEDFINDFAKLLTDNPGKNGWPDNETWAKATAAIKSTENITQAIELALFNLLTGDLYIRELVKLVEKGPVDLSLAAGKLRDVTGGNEDTEAAKRTLIDAVELASRARPEGDSAALLTARYHFFVRSLDGLSITFAGSAAQGDKLLRPRLLFGKHNVVPDTPGGPAVAFELQACGRCGQPFLRGHLTPDGRFVSFPRRLKLGELQGISNYFSIDLEDVVESSEDEDPLRDEEPPFSDFEGEGGTKTKPAKTAGTKLGDPQFICARCGSVSNDKNLACDFCRKIAGRISHEWIPVRSVIPTGGKTITTCPACGGKKYHGGSIIRAFSPGDDAAGAVLAQCLLSNIPVTTEATPARQKEVDDLKPKSRFSQTLRVNPVKKMHVGKRRLLAFSDSRQDAAYFASYMNRTGNQILHRQLIVKAAEKILAGTPDRVHFDVNDLIGPLINVGQDTGLFDVKDTELTRHQEACKWLNAELANIQRRQCLEGVGLITWDLKCSDGLQEIVQDCGKGLKDDYGIGAREFILLLKIMLGELRRQNVLQQVKNVNIRDQYFWPRNRPYTIRKDGVNSKLSIASWLPQAASGNSRSDLVRRLFARLGIQADKGLIYDLLSELWELSMQDGLYIWEKVPSVVRLWGGRSNDEVAWRLHWDAWHGSLSKADDILYKCPLCGNISQYNLKGICPTYRCLGTLVEMRPATEFAENHYRYIYNAMQPISLLALEHTAQITTREGAERQNNFTDDEHPLNVLSCSTTFELGVDVGQLHSVFLRNVPPGIANYVQRAGRAGRRRSAAAYVLTFCRSRPHDLGYFADVDKLISGKVQPPRIQIDGNMRIARRHLHAVALSHFWRFHHPELFNGPEGKGRGIVKWLFFNEHQRGAQRIYNWLCEKPAGLLEQLRRIFPSSIAHDLGFSRWAWVSELAHPPAKEPPDAWEGCLGLAQSELHSEHSAYEKLQTDNPKRYAYAERQMKRLKEKQLLGFLASRNVLPKYGFPVDVVSLKVESNDEWAQRIELDRDLRIALSEYAPGCTLVANGRVIKSYALEKVAGKQWPEYRFSVCSQCGKFMRSETSDDAVDSKCECGNLLHGPNGAELQGTIIQPIFGFRTLLDRDGQEPVEVRPKRTFTSRVYFSHYRVQPSEAFIQEGEPGPLSNVQIQKRYSRYGVLTVINPGIQNRGFWICPLCGYGDTFAGKPEKHKTPWGSPCPGMPRRACLGHEFHSDVLELRFSGGLAEQTEQGFWLSLTAALLAGAAKALDIERDDIDGTVLRYGGRGYRSIVLFDNVPGGAGYVKRIANALQAVMKAAFEIADSCSDCSRDQACNSCIQNYQNQYAHDLLSRGPVADFLRKALMALYHEDSDGYIPLGVTDAQQWLNRQIRKARKLELYVETVPMIGDESLGAKEFYKSLHDISLKEIPIRLIVPNLLKSQPGGSPHLKITLHWLAALGELPNVQVMLFEGHPPVEAPMFLETDDNDVFAIRWTPGKTDHFRMAGEVELSTKAETINKVRKSFSTAINLPNTRTWCLSELGKLLQGTKVIRLAKGERKGWKNILGGHLPPSIREVEIYDRYLRNDFQLRSLTMFIDALAERASEDGMIVSIVTTSPQPVLARDKFKSLQDKYAGINIKLKYTIHDESEILPHYRRVMVNSKNKKITIWLDKGLDIFRFEGRNRSRYSTIDSYLVIEG